MIDPNDLAAIALVVALAATLLAGYPVAFTLGGIALVGACLGILSGLFDPAFLTAFPQAIFSVMSSEILVAVPLFVFMGAMLERSRVAEDLLQEAGRLLQGLPGGLAVSITLVGALLAASTGIVGATVVTMGLIALPVMLRNGYDGAFAAGSVAAAGTLGQIIPPSIVLILLGDQISIAYQNAQFSMGVFSPEAISVTDLFAGALLPGLLLAFAYAVYQIAFALIFPKAAPPIVDDGRDPPDASRILRVLMAPLALIIAVLGSILAGLASPSEAASVGAVGALLLAGYRNAPAIRPALRAALLAGLGLLGLAAFFDLRLQKSSVAVADGAAIAVAILLALLLARGVLLCVLNLMRRSNGDESDIPLRTVLDATLKLSTMIFMIVIGARLFTIVFRGFGGDEMIEAVLETLPGGTAGAILLVMAVMFLLGFFLDFLEIVYIVVPLVAPVLLQMEMPDGSMMNPVWLGVMIAVNLQTSFLTPPFGFALFYLRGAAPETLPTSALYRGIIPFVVLQVVMLALLWAAPGLVTWLPGLV